MAGIGGGSVRNAKEWQDHAVCVGMDLDLFYGYLHEPSYDRVQRERDAIAVCNTCPVLMECRASALQHKPSEQHGVQGGMTADQRRSEKRRQSRRVSQPPRVVPKKVPRKPSVGHVPAVGTRRRLQALAVVGHGCKTVARCIGSRSSSHLGGIRSGSTRYVSEQVDREVAEAYRVLVDRVPGRTSQVVVGFAAERGWVGPHGWVGVDMDDPDARPRVVGVSAV